jgi:hypothetical protein
VENNGRSLKKFDVFDMIEPSLDLHNHIGVRWLIAAFPDERLDGH